jgi:hypothetical protein
MNKSPSTAKDNKHTLPMLVKVKLPMRVKVKPHVASQTGDTVHRHVNRTSLIIKDYKLDLRQLLLGYLIGDTVRGQFSAKPFVIKTTC